MYERVLKILKNNNVVLEDGLTSDEIDAIESLYEIKFPGDLQNFLMVALPVSKGFYNWRNKKQANVEFIKNVINEPARYINEMPDEIYWCEDWGEEPKDEEIYKSQVKRRLRIAPKLVPIYSHRYMPITDGKNLPIISIHGGDVIYMGENIEDYFDVEFGEKKQNEIDFSKISPISFWSDLM